MSKKSKQGATALFAKNVDAAECEFEGRFVPWGENQMLLIDDESPALHRWFITEIEQLRKENENLKAKVDNRDINLEYLRGLLEEVRGLLEEDDDDWATYTAADLMREREGGEA